MLRIVENVEVLKQVDKRFHKFTCLFLLYITAKNKLFHFFIRYLKKVMDEQNKYVMCNGKIYG